MRLKLARVAISLILIIVPLIVAAQTNSAFTPITDFSAVNQTVQVTSHDLTYTGDLYAVKSGSATIITPEGMILTNNHVIEDEKQEPLDAFELCLTTDQNKKPICEYTASLLARSQRFDLALLKIDSTDIRGNKIDQLPSLDYTYQSTLKVEQRIKIVGYPDIGGTTMTTTEGVISGFEEQDEITYIKSDTDLSSGNSGGTALDLQGHFIGIPTQVQIGSESEETLGYTIDLRSVRPWIKEHINDEQATDNKNDILATKKILVNDADSSHRVEYPFYPEFTLDFDSKWEIEQVDKTQVLATSPSNEQEYLLAISVERFPFAVGGAFFDAQLKKLEKNKKDLTNYERKDVTFAGAKAFQVTFTIGDQKVFIYDIPYGYALVELSYFIDLKNSERDSQKLKKVLDTFTFLDEIVEEAPTLSTYTHDNPPFSIKSEGKFKIQPQEQNVSKYSIINFLQRDNIDGVMRISYNDIEQEKKDYDNQKFLDEAIDSSKYSSGFALINKDPGVVLDGLKGWSLTYTSSGEEFAQTNKTSEIFLRNGDHYFSIVYDDLEKNYNKNITSFKKILTSFNYESEHDDEGVYKIGKLDHLFTDIVNHRYIIPITNLTHKSIITGYVDGSFAPENAVSRSEGLKMILDSKLFNEDKDLDKRSEIKKYKSSTFVRFDFADNKPEDWFSPYIRYARDKKIITGYSDNTFKPHSQITLAETLALLFKTYEIKVWKPTRPDMNIPWYKPYIDKAYEINLLPRDLTHPDHTITRAEMASIIDTLMTNIDEYFGF